MQWSTKSVVFYTRFQQCKQHNKRPLISSDDGETVYIVYGVSLHRGNNLLRGAAPQFSISALSGFVWGVSAA